MEIHVSVPGVGRKPPSRFVSPLAVASIWPGAPDPAETRMSGLDIDGRQTCKGAVEAVRSWVAEQGGTPAAGPPMNGS